jgi:hypothetical protein
MLRLSPAKQIAAAYQPPASLDNCDVAAQQPQI